MRIEAKITQAGLDNHRNFSRLTGRDATGKIVFRQRLEHKDRQALREDLGRLPAGTPVVLEGTFGWGWMSDEIKACRLDPTNQKMLLTFASDQSPRLHACSHILYQ